MELPPQEATFHLHVVAQHHANVYAQNDAHAQAVPYANRRRITRMVSLLHVYVRCDALIEVHPCHLRTWNTKVTPLHRNQLQISRDDRRDDEHGALLHDDDHGQTCAKHPHEHLLSDQSLFQAT